MSIDTVNDLPPRAQYIASASQTVFPYPFPIFQDADLVVEVDGAEQTLTTHYTVSGEGDDTGGDVTFVTGLTAGQVVTIYRDTVIERDADFQLNGPMFSTSVNDELDKLEIIAQEQRAATQRCLRIPMSAEVADADIALSPISNWFSKYLAFDGNGKPEPAELVAGTVSQSVIGFLLNPLTPKEQAATVTIVNYACTEGNGLRYGMNGDDATDNTAALASLKLVAAQGVKCFIPRGTYRYATSPNWAAHNIHLEGERGTILKHTGTGIAFNLDAGADSSVTFVTGMVVANLIITGNTNTTDGFFSRGVTYSRFRDIEVRSCSAKCFHIKWGVANTYDSCMVNRTVGGTFNPVPVHGWYVTSAGTGYYTADCTFIGCSAENFDGGVSGVGADFHDASGNTWIGGTFESLSQGLVLRAESHHNTFDGVWFESNGVNDIVDLGKLNSFRNLYCPSLTSGFNIDLNGEGASFYGGYLRRVECAAGSKYSSFHGVAFDSNASLGLTGTGTYSVAGCIEVGTGLAFVSRVPDVLGERGSFTATLTGCTTSPTGTVEYSINGDLVTLEIPVITGTSNTTAATLTGVPALIRPAATQRPIGVSTDNALSVVSLFQVETTGTITLFIGTAAIFTAAGTKGVNSCTVTYRLT